MSAPFRFAEALAWTHGQPIAGSEQALFDGVSIDTRTVRSGQLFVAIRGEKHDAHSFLDQAIEAGASGLMVERRAASAQTLPDGLPILSVEDTTVGLGDLARGHRELFRGTVIAITGSNGKTTTKEMCHAIMDVKAPCLKTQGNLNNEFGLPLTLLSRRTEDVAAVVELGMNHRGEIARLTKIARPDIGILTNIGTAHIGFLGNQENIALEKSDLIAGLGADGIAVLNADDPRIEEQASRAPGRILRFGLAKHADVRAEDVRFDGAGAFQFKLSTPSGTREVQIAGLADNTAINALAASAGALAAGADLDQIEAGLSRFNPVPGRMVSRKLASGARVIDDTYNANPQSIRAALESLVRLKGTGRAFAILGDMGELGEEEGTAHQGIGRLAAELAVDRLITLGSNAARVTAAAREAGLPGEHCLVGIDPEQIAETVGRDIRSHDWILVKGSRAMRMERVVEALIRREETH
ncbi:MAG: UDP-N-acetylmuramoyl-tripeptide--D-alanyl-D-alanine ligase [Myxococcota bacterium]|nr:UDP-N-acetylmuramoyl-tripeptide--D-alanyl-D-alanine ligase [Myxococcota bacterium]